MVIKSIRNRPVSKQVTVITLELPRGSSWTSAAIASAIHPAEMNIRKQGGCD